MGMKTVTAVAILALVAVSGCGGSDDESSYKLVKVTGTVTKEGQPLANFQVSFIPGQGNTNSTPSVAQTGPDGTYQLTFKGRTGVGPGKYKVVISPPVELPNGVTLNPEFADQPGMALMALKGANQGASRAKKKITEVKKEVAKTEFDTEVEDQSGGVTKNFDITPSSTAVVKTGK